MSVADPGFTRVGAPTLQARRGGGSPNFPENCMKTK